MEHPEKSPKPDLPPAAAELVGDIDSYQKRMEKEWESAKVTYEQKINHIMEEFLREGIGPVEAEPESKKTKPARVMAELERELRQAQYSRPHVPFMPEGDPDVLQLPWQGGVRRLWTKKIKFLVGATLAALIGAGVAFVYPVRVTPLPYTHTLGPVVWKGHIYIMDWFRKALYAHEDNFFLPIRSVEFIPNNLATGFAMSEKTVWSVDGFDKKILLHATTPDHQVSSSVDTPAASPVGLFYDGMDLWSADQVSKQLFRHRGNDLEDIRDTFQLPDVTVTALAFYKRRLWVLDGKSRLINVFRKQKPMLLLGSYDLDPFLKGATPTGFTIQGKKIMVVTENPATLTRIPLFRLKRSKAETF